jgi:hypothetical protein
MRKCLQNEFACATVLVLFLLAVAWNLSTTRIGSFSAPGFRPAVAANLMVAHGGTFPPDPWECFTLAHGGTFLPDPWECFTVAHGGTFPPDPWEC